MVSLDSLMVQKPTHASLLGKEISIMYLGEASKRMHEPMFYLVNPFAHEHVIFHYVHENYPDDSMFQEATNFKEVMNKITDLNTKSYMYKYDKDIKIWIFHERGDKLKIKQDL